MNLARFKKFITAEWSFIGVVVFFITHGYSLNLSLVPLPQLLLLFVILLAAAIIVYWLSKKFFRSGRKAAVFTSFVALVVLFFGVFQEWLDKFRLTSPLARLQVLVPLSFLAILIALILIKRSRKSFQRTILYCNILLVVYITIDLFAIAAGLLQRSEKNEAVAQTICDTCSKPSVYLIILDSYFGSAGVEGFYNYKDTAFEDWLRSEGFHVNKGSRSNYLFTLFSMSSLLNMDYIDDRLGAMEYRNHYSFTRAMEGMWNNKVCNFFGAQGYTINNFSLFDMKSASASFSNDLMPDRARLVTRQTMFYKIQKYLPGMLTRYGWISQDKIELDHSRTISRLQQRALPDANRRGPEFTYLHLLMPHTPYLFDSAGHRMRDAKKPDGSRYTDHEQFLQYQLYVNKLVADYVTKLKTQTAGQAVIMLMSDHGYQHAYTKDKKLPYFNLNAVYMPGGNYSGWYDGISNVNQFRVLFNNLFHQQMPMIKDSIVLP